MDCMSSSGECNWKLWDIIVQRIYRHFRFLHYRCMSAVCCGLMYTAGAVICEYFYLVSCKYYPILTVESLSVSDITAGKYKTIVCTLFESFWSVGVIMLPGVASFLSSWSYIYMAISMPTFFLIFLHR